LLPATLICPLSTTVVLEQNDVEITPGAIAKFGPVKLKQDALNQIDKSGPKLLINVYSGRRSSKDNLLFCGIYEDVFEPVQGKTIPIACRLIEEEFPNATIRK
jgi:hypothetical protein